MIAPQASAQSAGAPPPAPSAAMRGRSLLRAIVPLLALQTAVACAPDNITKTGTSSSLLASAERDGEAGACEQGLLAAALDAKDAKTFDKALGNHGPVGVEELPCLLEAVSSKSATKRRFAATLLVIVRRSDDEKEQAALAAQARVAKETSDPVVWALLMDRLLSEKAAGNADAKTATARTDMMDQAMRYTDADDAKLQEKVQALGRRVRDR
jgi:hypothetical protein